MIWDMRDCLAIRAILAADDMTDTSYDNETVDRIERITGRPFRAGDNGGMMAVMS